MKTESNMDYTIAGILRPEDCIIAPDDPVLITGANGFIGARLVENLLRMGFRKLRCFARRSSQMSSLDALAENYADRAQIEFVKGNLLSQGDCFAATKDIAVIYHLAAGRGEKSFPDAFMNSVVTTRNLLEASLYHKTLKRFVNVSSFSVYTNSGKENGRLLDETCAVEPYPALRGEAYCFAKVKQDEIVADYSKNHGIPTVVVRPGYVIGPGKEAITGRVGIDSFGVFLHLGGSNRIPFTYVDNCAEAIALAGIKKGIDGEVFNIVDDDLPSSRTFLRLYKRHVKRFTSLYVPHAVSYLLCYSWEKYAAWSYQQLPPVFNRRRWNANWKKTSYSNAKVKRLLGWKPRVPMSVALKLYFVGCRNGREHA